MNRLLYTLGLLSFLSLTSGSNWIQSAPLPNIDSVIITDEFPSAECGHNTCQACNNVAACFFARFRSLAQEHKNSKNSAFQITTRATCGTCGDTITFSCCSTDTDLEGSISFNNGTTWKLIDKTSPQNESKEMEDLDSKSQRGKHRIIYLGNPQNLLDLFPLHEISPDGEIRRKPTSLLKRIGSYVWTAAKWTALATIACCALGFMMQKQK